MFPCFSPSTPPYFLPILFCHTLSSFSLSCLSHTLLFLRPCLDISLLFLAYLSAAPLLLLLLLLAGLAERGAVLPGAGHPLRYRPRRPLLPLTCPVPCALCPVPCALCPLPSAPYVPCAVCLFSPPSAPYVPCAHCNIDSSRAARQQKKVFFVLPCFPLPCPALPCLGSPCPAPALACPGLLCTTLPFPVLPLPFSTLPKVFSPSTPPYFLPILFCHTLSSFAHALTYRFVSWLIFLLLLCCCCCCCLQD